MQLEFVTFFIISLSGTYNDISLTICIIFQNGQRHFKSLAANPGKFLMYVWPFWDIMYSGIKNLSTISLFTAQSLEVQS